MLSQKSRNWFALLVQCLGLAIVLGWWMLRGQAVALLEPPGAQAAQLPCVSYSPFHRGDINPFNYTASVSPQHIESDLRLLQSRTQCVRTYGLTQGLDGVVAVAQRLGMRVSLGVWISRDQAQNQAQLRRGIELAHQYPGTVERLIVGNEVLLRRELSPLQLGQLLDQARQASPVPVTYADVWEFWIRHAQLSQHVDAITVHILPYWEDQPVAVADAVNHVVLIAAQVQRHFAGKPVWVGETGWPAAGRQRDGAVPGRVEQAQFVRELLALNVSGSTRLDYNFIEAFDQPWKRSFEGAMGGYWGLFDPQGRAHAALTGAVVEDEFWWRGLAGAVLGLAVGLLYAAVRLKTSGAQRSGAREAKGVGEKSASTAYQWLTPALSFATLGAVLPVQWLMVQQWDRSMFEQCVSALMALVGWSVILAALWDRPTMAVSAGVPTDVLADAFADVPTVGAAIGPAVVPGGSGGWARVMALLRRADYQRHLQFAVLFAAAAAALVLLLDARYRPFPWWWFIAPTACLLALRVSGQDLVSTRLRKHQLLCVVMAACAIGIVLTEGWRNAQALGYGALLLVLAGTCAWPSRTNTSAASSAAGAHSSVV